MISMRIEGGEQLAAILESMPKRASRTKQRDALLAGGELIRARASSLAPRAPGAPDLADNINIGTVRSEGEGQVAVGIGSGKFFFYDCVFGPLTWVSTSEGQKAICQIKPGHKVLTQTGEFREVLGTMRFPAIEKPELVTFTAEYRKGSVHTLTLTRDHRVLVFRGNKQQWVPAGELVVGDLLSKRKKTSWNEGRARIERFCDQCGRSYICRSRGSTTAPVAASNVGRFCSSECRLAWVANRHVGMKRSDETKERMSKAKIQRFAIEPELHPNRIMAARGYVTKHEKAVADWLTTRGVPFRAQHPIGRAFVDFFLPSTNTVIEVDGAFWHKDQQRDIARDRRILAHAPDAHIIHLHFADPRFTPPDIDRQPLPNVSYVVCNPGPSSFVDPVVFRHTRVLSVKHWRYEAKPGAPPAWLYDLSVEGVNSFVASGLVIHNSFVEFGTSRQSPQPFYRPALDSEVPKAIKLIGLELWAALTAGGFTGTRGTGQGSSESFGAPEGPSVFGGPGGSLL